MVSSVYFHIHLYMLHENAMMAAQAFPLMFVYRVTETEQTHQVFIILRLERN